MSCCILGGVWFFGLTDGKWRYDLGCESPFDFICGTSASRWVSVAHGPLTLPATLVSWCGLDCMLPFGYGDDTMSGWARQIDAFRLHRRCFYCAFLSPLACIEILDFPLLCFFSWQMLRLYWLDRKSVV